YLLQREGRCPRLRPDGRIVHRKAIRDRVGGGAREALDETQALVRSAEARLVEHVHRLDDERVTLPAPARIAQPPRPRSVRPAVRRRPLLRSSRLACRRFPAAARAASSWHSSSRPAGRGCPTASAAASTPAPRRSPGPPCTRAEESPIAPPQAGTRTYNPPVP